MDLAPPVFIAGRKVLLVFCAMELGGAERQGLYFAGHLRSLGCKVSVLATHPGRGRAAELCEKMGIPWSVSRFRWPCRKISLVRDGWHFILALWRERPDIILSYTTCPNVGCGLFWRLSPAKICIWGQRNVDDLRGDTVERMAYRRVSSVICNAEHQVAYLHRTLGAPAAPIHTIHNGVSLTPPRRTRAEWRRDLSIPSNAVVATMLANFRPQKDHPTLLRAWKKMVSLPSHRSASAFLVLAGAPQQTYDEVRALAAELALGDTVIFLSRVQDVSGLLAASDIGVLVSTHEGLPNAVLEYMAAGLPVVASDLPGSREALGDDSENFLSPVGEEGRLADALQVIVGDPCKRIRLGEQNRQRSQNEFSLPAMCDRLTRCIANADPDQP